MATRPPPDPATQAILPALPAAAAATVLLARTLPIRFEYHPNALGIVSRTTQAGYPVEQEIFWFVFAGVSAALVTWGLARWLVRIPWTPRAGLVLEVAGAATLVAALALPTVLAALALAAFGAGAAMLGLRVAPAPLPTAADDPTPVRRRLGVWILVLLTIAMLRTPALPLVIAQVIAGVSDDRLVVGTWAFFAESGQHLAWALGLGRGELHGRDFFCLYGPLYDWALVGLWELLGRSIAVWNLYDRLSFAAALFALMLLAAALVRRTAVVLLLPFLVWGSSLNLRLGLALFGLRALHAGLAGGGTLGYAVAGALGGVALLYSQEYGLCLLLVAGLALAVRLDARGALAFATAVAAVTTPLLAYYAVQGALAPMLRDLVAYPSYLMAGYGNLPFPSLVGQLPLAAPLGDSTSSLMLRLGYLGPGVCVGALLVALRVVCLDPRRPLASLAALRADLATHPQRFMVALVALFGLLAFRTALGRSDLNHIVTGFAVPAMLLVVALDRSLPLLAARPLRALAAWRLAVLVGLLLVGGLGFLGADAVHSFRRAARNFTLIAKNQIRPPGDSNVRRVQRWVVAHTEPSDPVLFLPNNAAYHYLTQRPSPIRFLLSHQIVTEAQRAEVLRDLKRKPPRFVVWDDDFVRVDEIPDEVVLGRPVFAWLESHYVLETQLGSVRILRRRGEGGRL